jgi:hypothetical protein
VLYGDAFVSTLVAPFVPSGDAFVSTLVAPFVLSDDAFVLSGDAFVTTPGCMVAS